MLYKKANWLLSSAVEQTNQWRLHYGVSVEISRRQIGFCQTAQIIICARDSKNERGRNFKNSNGTVSKAIEQYQSPSSKTQVSPHICTILKDPADRTISVILLVSPLSQVKSEVDGPNN